MEKELNDMTAEELGKLFPVELCCYDPAWADLFEAEKNKITNAVGAIRIHGIHHIGSTAIPGIPAKPVIDILIEIQKNTDLNSLKASIQDLGYYFSPQPQKPAPHMMFMKGYSKSGYAGQAFHIHIRHPEDRDELFFRDYLIAHPDTARKYGNLKRRLQAEFEFDREGYTEAKTEFVRHYTRLAKEYLSFGKKKGITKENPNVNL
jgi:GrpB-like predicted nucleotidyltransferase (UPF0157 family)